MKLIHYSRKRLTRVDPRYHGSNAWTSRSEIQNTNLPRAYFYRNSPKRLQAPESAIKRGNVDRLTIHQAQIAENKLYDVYKDPDGIMVNHAEEWDVAVRGAGYEGFHNSNPALKGYNDIVALWTTKKVEKVGSWRL